MQEFILSYIDANQLPDENFGPDLSILLAEAQRVLGIRNSLLHNMWHPEPPPDHQHLLVLRFKGKIKLYSEVWSDEQLTDAVEDTISLLTGC